jgi:hypothetical protein
MNHRYFWLCCACGAENSRVDGECQFCECEGAACKRDNCSDPKHFEGRICHACGVDIDVNEPHLLDCPDGKEG